MKSELHLCCAEPQSYLQCEPCWFNINHRRMFSHHTPTSSCLWGLCGHCKVRPWHWWHWISPSGLSLAKHLSATCSLFPAMSLAEAQRPNPPPHGGMHWTWTLETDHNHCLTGKGKTPYVDCGQNLPEELALTQGLSWGPRDFVLMMYHCLHRNCKKKRKIFMSLT